MNVTVGDPASVARARRARPRHLGPESLSTLTDGVYFSEKKKK